MKREELSVGSGVGGQKSKTRAECIKRRAYLLWYRIWLDLIVLRVAKSKFDSSAVRKLSRLKFSK